MTPWDSSGQSLLTTEEVALLERFYGKVNSSSKQVKIAASWWI